MAPLPGLVKDPSPPASETELSPITIPDGTTLITTLQHNKIIDYLSGDASPDFIPQAAIDSLVTDLAGKEPSLGFTPENIANKVITIGTPGDDTNYPTEKAVRDGLDLKEGSLGFTPEDAANKVITIGTPGDDTNYPTEKAVRDGLDLKEDSLGFTPEDAADKGAISGYAGIDASQELLLVNFPSGTAMQVLRRNSVNDALEFVTPAAPSGITSINADTTAAQVIAGTINRISLIDVGATHTFDIDASYVGQASITTLGTITIGVWTGTAITGANINAASTDLTDSANLARNSNNLSFFAATTSLQLLGVISDETGSGLLVFGTSPTIVTPTIASFTNAIHDHEAAAGGGQLVATNALTATGTKDATTFLRGDDTWAVPAGGGSGDVVGPGSSTNEVISVFSGTTGKLIKEAGSSGLRPTIDVAGNFQIPRAVKFTSDSAVGPAASAYINFGLSRMVLNVPSANSVQIFVNNIIEYQFSSTTFILSAGNNILIQNSGADGYIDIDEITTPSAPVAGRGRLYMKNVAGDTHLFVQDDTTETDLMAGGGGPDTPWTVDHDIDRFDYDEGGVIYFSLFGPRVTPTDNTQPFIFYNDNLIPDAVVANIPSGDEFQIHFNGVEAYSFSSTTLDMIGSGIQNAGNIFLESITGDVILRLENTASSPAIGSIAGNLEFVGDRIGSSAFDYGQIEVEMVDTSSGSADGEMKLMVGNANTENVEYITLNEIGAQQVRIKKPIGFSITLADSINLILNTTNGSKIGTSTTQKLGFWNATPIIQPAHIADPSGGGTVDAQARSAIDSILSQLADMGLQASA